MTTIDIDAIRNLTDAATEGPWNVGVRWFDGMDNIPINAKGSDPDDPHQPDRIALIRYDAGGFQFPHADAKADAAFIAAARTLVPALCDELEQTREQRDLNSDLLDGAARALGIDLTDPDVHYAFDIPTKVAEVVAALTASRETAANLANEVGALKAELERMRAGSADAGVSASQCQYGYPRGGDSPDWCRLRAGHTGLHKGDGHPIGFTDAGTVKRTPEVAG